MPVFFSAGSLNLDNAALPESRVVLACFGVSGFRISASRVLGLGTEPSPRHLYPKPEAISSTGFRNKLM